MYYYIIERRAPNKGFRYKCYLMYDSPMAERESATPFGRRTKELGSTLTQTKLGARWWAKRTARKLDRFGHEDKVVEQQAISMPHA